MKKLFFAANLLIMSVLARGQKENWAFVAGPSFAKMDNAGANQKPSFSAHFGLFRMSLHRKIVQPSVGLVVEKRHFSISSYDGGLGSGCSISGDFDLFYLALPVQTAFSVGSFFRFGVEGAFRFIPFSKSKNGQKDCFSFPTSTSPFTSTSEKLDDARELAASELTFGGFVRGQKGRFFADFHAGKSLFPSIQNGRNEATRMLGLRFSVGYFLMKRAEN